MGKKKLVVIGGGAAGFFCAITAAAADPLLDVMILEKQNKLLSKVRISGGGRCNVTHACFNIADMVKNYPRGGNFLKKAFHEFFTTDTIKFFESRGVALKTEPDGRIFPVTNSSESIISCLMKEVNRFGIPILMNRNVKEITKQKQKFKIRVEGSELIEADYVCIACGGFSTSSQFEWIQKLSHSIEEPVPSLFTFNIPDSPVKELMGISVEDATIKIIDPKYEQRGPLLITHWGLSGPAILKLSSFAARDLYATGYSFQISVNWISAYNEQTVREKLIVSRNDMAGQKMINRNPFFLPQRLWKYLLSRSGINEDIRWADLPSKLQNVLANNLCRHEFTVKGKTTFKEEFVTAGGVQLREIDPTTMESKLVPGLFFAGEIMNVDGITGGFNFQHAWSTGWIAGIGIALSHDPYLRLP